MKVGIHLLLSRTEMTSAEMEDNMTQLMDLVYQKVARPDYLSFLSLTHSLCSFYKEKIPISITHLSITTMIQIQRVLIGTRRVNILLKKMVMTTWACRGKENKQRRRKGQLAGIPMPLPTSTCWTIRLKMLCYEICKICNVVPKKGATVGGEKRGIYIGIVVYLFVMYRF